MSKMIVQQIEEEVEKAFAQLKKELGKVEVDPSKEEKFGDYQSSLALKLSKELKRSPREIAQEAAKSLENTKIFEKVEIAGPGFINMTLRNELLGEWANACFLSDALLVPKVEKEKIIVEFSSPNIAKSMHVGHLRSTIIGDSIARLMEFLGYDVVRLNHVGDFGTQFGMLITYLKKYHPEVLGNENNCDLETLVKWYKESKKKFDEDAVFKTTSREEVVRLQSGEEDSVKAWKALCSISRKGFQEIYDLLDVHIEERGESFYNPILQKGGG